MLNWLAHKACSCNDNKYKYIQRILINSILKVDLQPHILSDPYPAGNIIIYMLKKKPTKKQYYSYSKIIVIHNSEKEWSIFHETKKVLILSKQGS